MNTINVWPDWPLILAYHSISDTRSDSLAVSVTEFDYQLAWLHRNGYQAMSLAQYTAEQPPKGKPIVIITFDDGYADNYHCALPVLQRYGFVATIFLVSDYVGTEHIFSWDRGKISSQNDRSLYQLLTWEQVEAMVAYGIEFGSHTCTHPELTQLTDSQCREEIYRSRSDLQQKLGQEISSFCYPRGDLNSAVIKMVSQAGYRCAVVTPTRSGIPLNCYTLRRVGVYYQNTSLHFRLKITPWLRRHYEHLKWLRKRIRM